MLDTNDGGKTATAFHALSQVVRILTEAVAAGREIEYSLTAGRRPLEPEVGPDGKKWSRAEPDGGFEFRLTVKPLVPDEAPRHPSAGVP